ncbi:rrna processing protein [Moniliophthora roreri]|nr:rrna processing protein [Moniliophthora roreri]
MRNIDQLKSKFSAEYRRHGNLKERHAWLRDNRTTICDHCTEKKLRCEPHPDNVRCEMCAKRKVRCSRSTEEKKARVMRKLDIDEDTFQKLLNWYERRSDSDSDDESKDMDIGEAKKTKKAEGGAVRTQAASSSNKSSSAKDSEKPTRISVKKPAIGLEQKPTIKFSYSSKSKESSTSNSGEHSSMSTKKHSGKTVEVSRSTHKSVSNTATVVKPKKATPKHVSSASTGSEALKDALNQANQSCSVPSGPRKPNRSDAASIMRSGHLNPQPKQAVRFEQQSAEYDEDFSDKEEELRDTQKASRREDERNVSIKSEHDEEGKLHETRPTRDSAFIDLHLIKRQLEVGMGTLTVGHPLRKVLQDSTERIGDLAALELDKMMSEEPTTTEASASKRPRDFQESSTDENPKRKLRKPVKPTSRPGFTEGPAATVKWKEVSRK